MNAKYITKNFNTNTILFNGVIKNNCRYKNHSDDTKETEASAQDIVAAQNKGLVRNISLKEAKESFYKALFSDTSIGCDEIIELSEDDNETRRINKLILFKKLLETKGIEKKDIKTVFENLRLSKHGYPNVHQIEFINYLSKINELANKEKVGSIFNKFVFDKEGKPSKNQLVFLNKLLGEYCFLGDSVEKIFENVKFDENGTPNKNQVDFLDKLFNEYEHEKYIVPAVFEKTIFDETGSPNLNQVKYMQELLKHHMSKEIISGLKFDDKGNHNIEQAKLLNYLFNCNNFTTDDIASIISSFKANDDGTMDELQRKHLEGLLKNKELSSKMIAAFFRLIDWDNNKACEAKIDFINKITKDKDLLCLINNNKEFKQLMFDVIKFYGDKQDYLTLRFKAFRFVVPGDTKEIGDAILNCKKFREDLIKDINNGFKAQLMINKKDNKSELSTYNFIGNPCDGKLYEVEHFYNKEGIFDKERISFKLPGISVNEKGQYVMGSKVLNIVDPEELKYSLRKVKSSGKYIMLESDHAHAWPKVESLHSHKSDINKSFEVIFDKNHSSIANEIIEYNVSPVSGRGYVIHSKRSDILESAYDIKLYFLDEYPESTDIIQEIKDGTIKGGTDISKVTEENGVITLNENFERNGFRTKRTYTKDGDNNKYSYKIINAEGKEIFNLERSFNVNDDGTTITIVNGKKYFAYFDKENKTIKIVDDAGKETILDLKDKNFIYDSYEQDIIFDIFKNMTADSLIALRNTAKRFSCHCISEMPHYNKINKEIVGAKSKFTNYHELGHSIDSRDIVPDKNGEASLKDALSQGNKELVDIYNKEMQKFMDEYPEDYVRPVDYFGFRSSGLSEIFAETNALCMQYGADEGEYATRSQFVIRYFPETFAKIAEMLGYNGVKKQEN